MIIFSLLIIGGFHISLRSLTGKKIVTVIYTLTLLWYTFLCRLPLLSTPVYGSDTAPVETAEPTVAQQIWKAVATIFGSQPDGTLAGGGVFISTLFNCLLFIPLGFLLLLWIPKLREKRKGRIAAVAVCLLLSVVIECVQEVTGLGMADWKDVISNTLGAAVGVGMVMMYDRCVDTEK